MIVIFFTSMFLLGNLKNAVANPVFNVTKKATPGTGNNTAPVLVNNNILELCENAVAVSINYLFTVTDPDVSQTETFLIIVRPVNGSITTGTTVTSGTNMVPTGWTYTPSANFVGKDSFTIKVTDGNGGIASTFVTVIVFANPTPLVFTNGKNCDGSVNLFATNSLNPAKIVWNYSSNAIDTATITYPKYGTTIGGTSGTIGNDSNLYNPNGIFVAANGVVYVADASNNRIQKFVPGSTAGITVAG